MPADDSPTNLIHYVLKSVEVDFVNIVAIIILDEKEYRGTCINQL